IRVEHVNPPMAGQGRGSTSPAEPADEPDRTRLPRTTSAALRPTNRVIEAYDSGRRHPGEEWHFLVPGHRGQPIRADSATRAWPQPEHAPARQPMSRRRFVGLQVERSRLSPGQPASKWEASMSVAFPGESAEYRAARDRLLVREIELRREMEAVA